jgi:hypothetical protein
MEHQIVQAREGGDLERVINKAEGTEISSGPLKTKPSKMAL